MSLYRNALPQLSGDLFLTDGGVETTLVFHEGLELPYFAAFDLLKTPQGELAVRDYYRAYAELSKKFSVGLILESTTWRAIRDWGMLMGYSAETLAKANRKAMEILEEIRREFQTDRTPVVISGCLGPRGDGYVPGQTMSTQEAKTYHLEEIETLSATSADMVCSMTMNHAEEAIGIAWAARQAGMPVCISFTVETDDRLPTGQTPRSAIEQVDDETAGYPVYYMINCAHPTHFETDLAAEERWLQRILGLRANASRMSHAELDEVTDLDPGNPLELGQQYAELKTRLKHLSVLGGCCGADLRHIEQIAAATTQLFREPL